MFSYYPHLRALEQGILRLARQRGLDGDPFAEVPSLGDWHQEQAIIALQLDTLPRPRTAGAKDMLAQMARAIVLSSTPPEVAAQQAAKDWMTRKLATDRRRLQCSTK